MRIEVDLKNSNYKVITNEGTKCGFCNKLFYKDNGIVHKNKIFCSVDCFNKDSNKIEEKENEEEDEVQNDTKFAEENKDKSEEMIDILDI